MILKNATVLTDDFCFRKCDVKANGNIIESVALNTGEGIDCTGKYIVPGLCDNHTHGCIGYDSSEAFSVDVIDRMSRFYASNGVTTFLPTVTTTSAENALRSINTIADAYKNGVSGANVGGIHMEGPYFSEKYKGAQNPAYLRNPDIEEFTRFNEASGGIIRLIAIAPELEGTKEFVSEVSKICAVSIGHTDADEQQARIAIECGAGCMTHTFNAMRPLHHRNPNAIGAALDSDICCEFICDGFHINKTVIRIMYKLLGDERMLLVSDSVRAAGMPDGQYEFSGRPIIVKDGKVRFPDGTISGSSATLFECVKKAIEFGIPPESAFKMASYTPAKLARISDVCGSISAGKRADMLILDENFNIEKVIIRGEFFEKRWAD